MPTYYNLIEEKAEDAFEAYIGAITGVTVIKGLEEDAGVYPALLIVGREARPAQESDPTNGNWIVSLDFIVMSDMTSTTRATHRGYVGQLSDKLIVDDLESTMKTAISGVVSDFVPDLWTPGRRLRTINAAGKRVTTIQGELMCRSA